MSSEEFKMINERLDKIEQLAIISAKQVLNIDEVVLLSGLSKGYLYKLTSNQQIPHYKHKSRHIYFKKTEIEEWLTNNKAMMQSDINSKATTYTAINRR